MSRSPLRRSRRVPGTRRGRCKGTLTLAVLALAAVGAAAATPARAGSLLPVPASGPAELPDDLDPSTLKTGDLIFHTSRSNQSGAILWATKSPYSHVGLVRVYRGEVFVLEAAGKVRVVPLAAWTSRGRLGRFTVKRVKGLDDDERERVWRAARAYRGRPYDVLFLFGNRGIYCSELVWLAYQDALGRGVGEVERAGDLDVDNPLVGALFEKRWRRHPTCRGLPSRDACADRLRSQELITPASMAADERLELVYSNYPPGLR